MKITTSYAVEIKHIDKLFRNTNKIYSDAISFCIKIFEENWSSLKDLDLNNKEQYEYADSLIHSTKSNVAKYPEFDKKFHKLPSYLRIAVINTALGQLNSYHSNLQNWYDNGCKNKRPTLQTKLHKMPVFYKHNMYKDLSFSDNAVSLKLFVNNDWNWVKIKLKHTDLMTIYKKTINATKLSTPTLERKNKKWFLRFAVSEKVELSKKHYKKQTICAVDLGINTDATCSIMQYDGTILRREFINFNKEKDLIKHTLNKIKKIQQKEGSHNITKLWRYAKFHNDELAKKIATAITKFAYDNNCDVIVFEHLNTDGKKRGSKKQLLTLWKKNTIQNIVETKAHKLSMRISRICAWNTSKLAFDGSGETLRGKKADFNTYELCKFSNGKIYNCDLSASYNIGARYFIRCIKKSTSEKKWSGFEAKVPDCQKRTKCTYATLLQLNDVA